VICCDAAHVAGTDTATINCYEEEKPLREIFELLSTIYRVGITKVGFEDFEPMIAFHVRWMRVMHS
jgi:hypothetical protein